ncbi:thioredoxin family protein [Bacillus sp. FJAT-45037]|uniref:thioredoxin family protein n=1 Tax=Bacillus sp. FJAT-45037 TaxID=2011007 RepID=UPI000C2334F5|nr:thioredoxin family protein [Bacillus sp. FJAT-45037]
MKKIIIFGGIVVTLFVLLAVVTNLQEDPHYQNTIEPSELNESLQNGQDVTVYYYSPTCPACQEATPRLNEITENLGVNLLQYNINEHGGWDTYNVEFTPTIIHYENGEEVARVDSSLTNEEFTTFFEENVINE